MEIKGNVIVGQSGGPTAVINSSLAGVYKTAKDKGIKKIYGMRNGVEGFLKGRYVDLSEHITSDMDIELLKRTPSSFLGSCRFKLPEPVLGNETFEALFAKLKELEIGYFFYIGGNDSMDTIKKLSDYAQLIQSEIKFIGIPKTIDNDLDITDHTPGYGSAAKYIASVTKEVVHDGLVYDMESVTILEIMGRNAGWLTAAAALAKGCDCEGVDLVYLPEVAFNVDTFIETIRELQKTKKSIVVAISEGICLADGTYVAELSSQLGNVDAFGHKILTGAGRYLASVITNKIGCKARAIEFNTLQRCASHMVSRVDITEAFQVGGAGVSAALEGKTGQMVILKRVSNEPYMCVTDVYDVHKIANVEKKVPREWINEEGNGVTEAFISYVKPLIQAELTQIIVDGLPHHITLKDN